MQIQNPLWLAPITLMLLNACDMLNSNPSAESGSEHASMQQTGWLVSDHLNEASGLQASYSRSGDFFVHNDDGQPTLYAIDESGADLGSVAIVPAKNRDWEDLTSVPVNGDRWIVAGDIGDNYSKRQSIRLYFVEEPKPGKNDRYDGSATLEHWLILTYPDGPRDCESMAYDPVSEQILLLSKRDKPPRLYAVDLEAALTQDQAELEFLGTTSLLRPPTVEDQTQWGGRTDWISQPTGFDISADGSEAVVITFRSLYRYRRQHGEDWLTALQKQPVEIAGPPTVQNEAVAYSTDGTAVYITTEKRPAPVYRFELLGGGLRAKGPAD